MTVRMNDRCLPKRGMKRERVNVILWLDESRIEYYWTWCPSEVEEENGVWKRKERVERGGDGEVGGLAHHEGTRRGQDNRTQFDGRPEEAPQ